MFSKIIMQLVIVALIAGKPPVKLTPLELAIGEELTKSRKRRRELIDMSYHRSVYLFTKCCSDG